MATKRGKTNGSVKAAPSPISPEIAKSLAPMEKTIPEFPQPGESLSPNGRNGESNLDMKELLNTLLILEFRS